MINSERIYVMISKGLLTLSFWFRVLRTPLIWFPTLPYDSSWDETLQQFFDDGVIHIDFINEFTCTVNDYEIWIANYPYCAFHRFHRLVKLSGRPSRKMMFALYDALEASGVKVKNGF